MIILFSGLLFVGGMGFLYLAFLLICLNIALRILVAVLTVIVWLLNKAVQREEIRIVIIDDQEYELPMKDVTPRSRLLT